jgi:iron(III) transport system substrate-binding protein
MPTPLLAPTRHLVLLAALVGAVLLTGCPSHKQDEEILVTVTDTGDQTGPGGHEKIVEQAKAEGEFCWYTSLPEVAAQALLTQFGKAHPAIKTNLVRGSTFDIVKRLDAEVKAGKVQCDALHVLDVAAFVDLKRRGELYRYVSAEDKAFPGEYKDPGYWIAMRAVTLAIAYDTRRVTAQQAPRTWWDLLKPEWRGKIGLKDAATAGTAYTLYYFLRDLYGYSYWRKMAAQKPRLYRSASDMLAGLKAGEITLAAGVTDAGTYRAVTQDKQPIAAVAPSEGLPMMLGPIAIAADAPHPNCAKLFVDFVLSKDGQTSLRALSNSYSVRADVPPPDGQTALAKLKLLSPTGGWDAYYQAQDVLQQEYSRLFRLER